MWKIFNSKVAVVGVAVGSLIMSAGSSVVAAPAPPEPGIDLVRIVNEFVPKSEIQRSLKASKKLNPKAGAVTMKASGACSASGAKVTMGATPGVCTVTYSQANKGAAKGAKGKYKIKVIAG